MLIRGGNVDQRFSYWYILKPFPKELSNNSVDQSAAFLLAGFLTHVDNSLVL